MEDIAVNGNHSIELGGTERFCGSKFWDLNVTRYFENPDLIPCLEKTILVWIPCAFLWIFSLLDILYIYSSKDKNIPWTLLNISKLLIKVILIVVTLIDLSYTINASRTVDVSPVDHLAPVLKMLSFAYAGLLLLLNLKKGLRSSGLLFLFWLILCLCEAVQLRSRIEDVTSNVSKGLSSSSVLFICYYTMLITMLFLNFFADAAPTVLHYPLRQNPCPEEGSSFLSRILFSWYDSLSWKGFRKPLEKDDLWNLNREDMAEEVIQKFLKHWERSLKKVMRTKGTRASSEKTSGPQELKSHAEKNTPQASVLPAMIKAFGLPFFYGYCLKLITDFLTFVNPLLLRSLIEFVKGDESMWKGYLYVGLMCMTSVMQTIILGQSLYKMELGSMRIRTALIAAIYRKALLMSNVARKESTVGGIVNLLSVDVQQIMDMCSSSYLLWSAPLQIILAFYFLWQTLGPSILSGITVMIILIPVNGFISSHVKALQGKQMEYKDKRIMLMNEVLNGMKVLKLYAWEPSFEQKIVKMRNKEVDMLKKMAYLKSGTSFIWSCAPFLVSLVTFATYVLIDENNILDPSKAFVSLTLFNAIRVPLGAFPQLIIHVIQAKVSLQRVNEFMNSEELDITAVTHDESERDPVVVENASFTWDKDGIPALKSINLRMKKGALFAVVGSVGSGKSSLISALLGEMEKISGRVNTKGTIAYVPQQAWIQNATLRKNIIFGKRYNRLIYKRVVNGCALKPDVDMLPGGDQTEIGEKGIQLSGGQRQRVSVARAVYSNADIYFFDDPLSAVDSHVGKQIFENVIGPKGVLKKKTRILVTHGITFLPDVDQIVVMKDGTISEFGSYDELIGRNGAFSEFLIHHLQEMEPDEGIVEEEFDEEGNLEGRTRRISSLEFRRYFYVQKPHDNDSYSRKKSGAGSFSWEKSSDAGLLNFGEKLIEEERAETGVVKWSVYSQYMISMGIYLFPAIILLHMLYQGFSVSSNFWLSAWSNDNTTLESGRRDMYLIVYGVLGGGQATTLLLSSLCLFIGTLRAAKNLHHHILSNVLRTPTSFFDTTPVGRILNRFSRDMNILDTVLPAVFKGWTDCFFGVLSTLFVITYSTPIFFAVVIPIGILYYLIQRFYAATSRQLKRLLSVSRSPIYSHFGESINGASTIRAFKIQQKFIKENENIVDVFQCFQYPYCIAKRWLSIRLEMIGSFVILFSSLFAVIGRHTINAGTVGLSISYALQITQVLNRLVRLSCDVENNIVAVERIKEYGELEKEAPWDIQSNAPPKEWPSEGKIEFRNFQVRYREGLDLVLKGINCSVNGGEKVGIVGRTGAGKSSLSLALFRVLESAGGTILIDDLDISKMGLHALRGSLTIIPQDPVLFSGTLRMNLDPFEKHCDVDIWRALEQAHLDGFIESLPEGLQFEVSEGGENLSVGQKQLICLARALLKKSKVLILDEATAAVDLETDELIQATIRTEFKDCTILSIAHRLNTILDCDKIIVFDKGTIVEYDSPGKLLESRTSVFYGMVKDAGLVLKI